MASLPRSSTPPTPFPRPQYTSPQPNARLQLRREWVRFLSRYPWSAVLTLTFGPNRRAFRCSHNSEQATKAFRRLIRDINETLYGRRWMSKPPHGGVVWARVHELQKDGTSHYHAVIYSPGTPITSLHLSRMKAWWQSRYGRAVVEIPRCNFTVLRYLVKHVGDPDPADIDWSHSFMRQS